MLSAEAERYFCSSKHIFVGFCQRIHQIFTRIKVFRKIGHDHKQIRMFWFIDDAAIHRRFKVFHAIVIGNPSRFGPCCDPKFAVIWVNDGIVRRFIPGRYRLSDLILFKPCRIQRPELCQLSCRIGWIHLFCNVSSDPCFPAPAADLFFPVRISEILISIIIAVQNCPFHGIGLCIHNLRIFCRQTCHIESFDRTS